MSADAVKVLQATEYAHGYEAVEELRGVVAVLLAENETLRAAMERAGCMCARVNACGAELAEALAARGGDAT